ncbi:MAG TPA: hypothetical protein VLB49_03920 [Gemmatimonadales bacterium]|nr:hypothetical protein [Gemmatimonadales bacterium]
MPRTLWGVLWTTFAGVLACLALLIRQTPYTLTAFMFLGQPLLVVAVALFGWRVLQDPRRRGLV